MYCMNTQKSDVVIVGAGITGISTAYFLRDSRRDLKITLIEGTDRFGGKIKTELVGGVPGEAGPDTFALGYPAVTTLLEKTRLADKVIKPYPNRAYILTRKKLHPIPDGLVMGFPSTKMGPLIKSGVLSPVDLLRCSMDLFLPKTKIDEDISIGKLARERFGKGLKESIVDPLIGGIMACSSDRLSTKEVMPPLFEAAKNNRSLILAMRKTNKNSKTKRAGAASFINGLEYMVKEIMQSLDGVQVISGERVTGLEKTDGSYRLETENQVIQCRSVVLAIPSMDAAKILKSSFPDLSDKLSKIEYTSVAIVLMLYRQSDFRPPFSSSGFLVSPREGKLMTASTWLTMKWEYAKSDDYFLVRCFVGSPEDKRWMEMGDEEISNQLNSELSEIVQIAGKPVEYKVIRWFNALPQYSIGHVDIVRNVEENLPPGIYLAGAAYHGVGVPSCITDGANTAKKIQEIISNIG
jgi:oxygen-dependent protoporphyrinogen oxidase